MHDSVGDRSRSALRWMLGGRLFSLGFNAIAALVTIRLLGPSEFGLAAIMTMLVGFAGLVNEIGLATSLVRSPTMSDEFADRTQGLLLIVNLCTYVLVVATAPLAEHYFGFAGLKWLLIVGGLQLVLQGQLAAPTALMQREMRFSTIAVGSVVEGVISGAATVVLAWLGNGVWSLVFGSMLGTLSRAGVVLTQIPRMPRPRPSLQGMSETLKFGGTLTLGQILWAAYTRADTFIVGKLLGQDTLGLYSVAMQVATLPMEKIVAVLNKVGLAAFANVQKDPPKVREKFLWVSAFAAGAVFPVFWGISAVTPELVHVLLGQRWVDAAVPLALICLPVPLRFLSSMSTPVVVSLGRADIPMTNTLAACAIMIPSFVVGARWGLFGVGVAWVVGYALFFVYRSIVTLGVLGVPASSYFRALAPSAAAAVVMFAVVAVTREALVAADAGWVARLVLLIAAGGATYGACTYAWNRSLFRDVRQMVA